MAKESEDIVEALRSLEERIEKRFSSLEDQLVGRAGLRPALLGAKPRLMRKEGTLEVSRNGGYAVEFERHFDQPIDEVWRTMTDPGRMLDWYADADVDQREGGKIVLRFANSGATAHGIVTEHNPPSVFEHMWVTGETSAPAQPIPEHLAAGNGTCGGLSLAASVIRYELTKAGEGGTNLKLNHYVPMNPRLIPAPLTRAARGMRSVTDTAPPDMVMATWEILLELLDGALRNPGNRTMSLRSAERRGGWPWDRFHDTREKYAQTMG